MMNNDNSLIQIVKRKLLAEEIREIRVDIRTFPDLAFIKPGLLESFSEIYVAEYGGKFAGFCAVESYRSARKLGPIAVKKEYQKNGIGLALMYRVLAESKGKRTYFGTSNQKLREYGLSIGAIEYTSLLKLPNDIKRSSIHYLIEYMSFRYLYEVVRKLIKYGRNRYTYFLLP
jgi:GNAT superfamily N-acetyltransferase